MGSVAIGGVCRFRYFEIQLESYNAHESHDD